MFRFERFSTNFRDNDKNGSLTLNEILINFCRIA